MSLLLSSILDNLSQDKTNIGMKYVVATQDKSLRLQLAQIPGVPLIYFNKVSLVLEPPSEASKQFNKSAELSKVSVQETESKILETLNSQTQNIIGIGGDNGSSSGAAISGDSGDSASRPRLKRKSLSANPLSIRPPSADSQNTKRRKREKYKRK